MTQGEKPNCGLVNVETFVVEHALPIDRKPPQFCHRSQTSTLASTTNAMWLRASIVGTQASSVWLDLENGGAGKWSDRNAGHPPRPVFAQSPATRTSKSPHCEPRPSTTRK